MQHSNWQPIDYARSAVETMMRAWPAADLPPKGRFHYHQGVFLSGVYKTWQITRTPAYIDYIKAWVDSIIDPQGSIHTFDPRELDDIQPGILLFPLLARTGDRRYRVALDTLLPVIRDFPRNDVGGFWHKHKYPNQMWLDGLYMAGPIAAEYGATFGQPEYIDLVVEQALLMRRHTRDARTGLLYHAWDASREAAWADPQTGLSPEFWGRSIGWVPVGVLDDLDFVPEEHPGHAAMVSMATGLLEAVCRYQSEEGRWYQVVDKPGAEGNWLENSCSCLFVAGLCKAVRKGLMGRGWLEPARRGYEAVVRSLGWIGEDVQIGQVCIGTSVGDYKHYCERPTSTNDLHGVGAFLLMCEEMAQVEAP